MSKPSILYVGNDNFCYTGYENTMHTLSNLLIKDGFSVIRTSKKKNKFLRLIDMIFSLFKYANKVDYVLIDTFSTSNFYYAIIISQLSRIFGVRYIPILHGGNLPSRLKNNPKLSKAIFKNAFVNISPSGYLKEAFEKFNFKVELIPNTYNFNSIPFKERKKIRPRILWVRAFKELYNPLMAIEVFYKVKSKFPDAILCMIGPFKDNSINTIKEKVYELKIEDDIEITGVLSKQDWFHRSKEFDIFINTTTVDNTPLSVLEAMALGLTVVSTDVGGLPYLIKNNQNGFLVENMNSEQMADTIIDILESQSIEIQINARSLVEEFSWDKVKPKWNNILK